MKNVSCGGDERPLGTNRGGGSGLDGSPAVVAVAVASPPYASGLCSASISDRVKACSSDMESNTNTKETKAILFFFFLSVLEWL